MGELLAATMRDLTDEHIRRLVSDRATEGLHLEFKSEMYDHGTSGKSEALKDISAFANTEGGWIIIGITEDSEHRASGLHSVDSANEEVAWLRDICSASIELPLRMLEIQTLHVDGDDVIAIYVPDEEPKPRWVRHGTKRRIPRRTNDATTEMSMQEFRNLILRDRTLLGLAELKDMASAISQRLSETESTAGEPTSSAVPMTTTFDDFVRSRKTELEKSAVGKPMFVIAASPNPLEPGTPLIQAERELAALLRNPPALRMRGWDLGQERTVRRDDLGLTTAQDYSETRLRMAWNGYAEYTASVTTDAFQWAYVDLNRPRPLYLDPRAMIEPIVCFLELLQRLATIQTSTEKYHVWLGLLRCPSAKLIEHPPDTHGHRMAMIDPDQDHMRMIKTLDRDPVWTPAREVPVTELTDITAKMLATEVYREFGFSETEAPFFDSEGRSEFRNLP